MCVIINIFYTLILVQLVKCRINGQGDTCGRPLGNELNLDMENRIVAGYDVGYYRYSWYVALLSQNTVSCGGALVGRKTVLTAAHCFKTSSVSHNKTKPEDLYQAVLGMYNKCEKEKTQKSFTIEKVHVHELYAKNTPYFDIALVILKESTEGYQPICLPKSKVKERPREGTVPGLGTLRYHGATPCTLHEARLLIYSDEDCKAMIKRTGNDPKKMQSAFCAGYVQGGTDTCQGDSGGPLQIVDEAGNYVLLGVVSFGFHCANPGLLGMYTDISDYLTWINEKSGQNLLSHSNANDNATNSHSNTTSFTTPSKLPNFSTTPYKLENHSTATTVPQHEIPVTHSPPHYYQPQQPAYSNHGFVRIVLWNGNNLIVMKRNLEELIKKNKKS